MKNIVFKSFEPALLVLIIAGALAIITFNYFAYLQFIGQLSSLNIINLFVGILMILLQLSVLLVSAGLALLAATALKKYLGNC